MVYCCVPQCGTDSWRCDPSITFHDFPSSPDLAAKWIQQVNNVFKSDVMWFPRANSVVCSKHFLSTDYKEDSDSLKPRVVPTIFGHRYIGLNSDIEEISQVANKSSGPLIVKIKTEDGGKEDVFLSDISSQNSLLERIINEPENLEPGNLQSSLTPTTSESFKTYSNQIMGIQPFKPTYQDFSPNVINVLPIAKPNKIASLDNGKKHQALHLPVKGNSVNVINSLSSISKKTKAPKLSNKSSSLDNKVSEKSKAIKKPTQKRDNNDNNLIEIGPNTFLKINPEIIKVNKKQTPSGNTVLQFLMDQKLANTIGTDVLPKIVQGAISNIGDATSNLRKIKPSVTQSTNSNKTVSTQATEPSKTGAVVHHVVGHLVDTHVCKESCSNLDEQGDNLMETDNIEEENNDSTFDAGTDDAFEENSFSPTSNDKSGELTAQENLLSKSKEVASSKADSSYIAKAPILLTTNMPLAHCFMEKTKYLANLKQKARQIASLKQKVAKLNKKIEELEDRCVVQERQLSFSFLRKLRTIRKNASKGDPPATYILEQIRAYTGQKQMRWSDSTLQQCAIWCKKAPYAYEYFKRGDFFKLPCLGTVKRFMKKHPDMTFSNKAVSNTVNDDGESSSDFNFDEEDSTGELDNEMKDNQNGKIVCESVITEETNTSAQAEQTSYQNTNLINQIDEQSNMTNTVEVVFQHDTDSQSNTNTLQNIKIENAAESKTYPITVNGTNVEVQELILPSGEVVQCYSSNICNGGESNSQYFIIPSTGDTGTDVEHEYSIVQSADSAVILQNIENSNLQQEQLIFITNSSDQVECTETEVMTNR